MASLRIHWHAAKATENFRKYGVSFDEPETIFSDDHALLLDDPDHSEEEARFLLLGLSSALRVLIVVHFYREADAVIRIVSARKATPTERAQYDARWSP